MNKILVVVPFYNVERWIAKCVESIKTQQYQNFACVLLDDLSTDNSYEKCVESTISDERFSVIKNKEKKYALKNIVDGIKILDPEDDDIIITVDGDDWLYDDEVFNKIINRYSETECLLTYGNYEKYPTGHLGHCTKYPDVIIENNLFRNDTWRASHLRTFKYKLWKNIKNEDFLNPEGEYLDSAYDHAIMFPMLEMAQERQEYFDEPLYVYNEDNPNNNFKTKPQKQRFNDVLVRRKGKYERL